MGKIVILWAWGAAAVIVDLHVLKEYEKGLTEHVFIGFTLLGFLLIVPLSLLILTWRWLGGKEAAGNAIPSSAKQSEPVHPNQD